MCVAGCHLTLDKDLGTSEGLGYLLQEGEVGEVEFEPQEGREKGGLCVAGCHLTLDKDLGTSEGLGYLLQEGEVGEVEFEPQEGKKKVE